MKNAEDTAISGKACIPEAAWTQVHITAPDSLTLAETRDATPLEVTVVNDSAETLDPGSGEGIMLSFRLVGAEFATLRHECAQTRLSQRIPPGGQHTQEIAVAIPEQFADQVIAIRVGLVQKGKYWVERINRAHPRIVEIRYGDGRQTTHAQQVAAEASRIWPQGNSNGLRWPHGSMMVSERHKILYVPVAKCACTSLKSMMVELAGIRQPETALRLGVHFVTDRFNTGVQLKDKSMKVAWQILASDQYFKFSVIREPFERLVSAYMEKFVYNRTHRRNLLHTRPVISEIQGGGEIDLQRGISFDEFVEYILGQDPMDLDPHWRPQHLYMAGVKHMSRIFRLEDVAQLESWLQRHLDIAVKLAHKNKTDKSQAIIENISTMSAAEISALGAFDHDSFLSSRNRRAVQEYFREDFKLYRSAGA